jgi:hypothetical protein
MVMDRAQDHHVSWIVRLTLCKGNDVMVFDAWMPANATTETGFLA